MTATSDTTHSDDGITDGQDSSVPISFDAFRWSEQRHWTGAIALAAVFATFWLFGGAWGAVAWVGVAGSWFVFPPVVSVALGQFALLALLPTDGGFGVVLGSIALLALLVSDIVTEMQDLPDGLLFVGSAVILGGAVFGLAWTTGLVAAAVGIVVLLVTVSYLLHRVLLFKLGHLSATSE